MYIKHLQLSKFPCPPKSPNGEFGNFCGFQPSGMPTFQILRFAEIEINPCNSTSNTGTKKPNGVSPYGIKTKKWWGIYNQIRTHSLFCKHLIIKHSQVTHELQMVIHSFQNFILRIYGDTQIGLIVQKAINSSRASAAVESRSYF